jgi:hypothetical protein
MRREHGPLGRASFLIEGAMNQQASSRGLCRGTRFPRALKRVNREVLVTAQQAGPYRAVGDAEIAEQCGLHVRRHPDRVRPVIEIPESATRPPRGINAYPDSGRLYFMTDDLIDAARVNRSLPPPVIGMLTPKSREVFLHGFDVRIQQQLLVDRLQTFAEPVLPATAVAGRRGVHGVHVGCMLVKDLLRRGFSHAIRADIRAFFTSISAQQVLDALPQAFPVEDGLMNMIDWNLKAPVIRSEQHRFVQEGQAATYAPPLRALYQGSSIAPVLSNIVGYVTLDRPFQTAMRGAAVVIRYVDDLFIMARDRESLSDALAVVELLVSKAGWKMHPGKTSLPTDLRTDILTFLGYSIGRGSIDLSASTYDALFGAVKESDPQDHAQRSAFMRASTTLINCSSAAVNRFIQSATQISPYHEQALNTALTHVKANQRPEWIAAGQRLISPFIRQITPNPNQQRSTTSTSHLSSRADAKPCAIESAPRSAERASRSEQPTTAPLTRHSSTQRALQGPKSRK